MSQLRNPLLQQPSFWKASHSTKYNPAFYQTVIYTSNDQPYTLSIHQLTISSECDVDRELDKLTASEITKLLPNFRKLAREFSSNQEHRPRIIRSLLRLPESERDIFATQVQGFFEKFPVYPSLQSTCIEGLASIECSKDRTRLLKIAFNFTGNDLDNTANGWIIIACCNMTNTQLSELNTQVLKAKAHDEDHEPILKEVIKQAQKDWGLLKEEAKGQPVVKRK